MAWDTVHDYIRDPAGFEAHHRQWEALCGSMTSEQVSTNPIIYESDLRLTALEAVADAARAIVDNEGGCASGGWREGSAFLTLSQTVDAWLAVGKQREQ